MICLIHIIFDAVDDSGHVLIAVWYR